MTAQVLNVPRSLRRGGVLDDMEKSVQDAVKIVQLVCRQLGLADLSESRILDMGCGFRMSKTLLEQDMSVTQYVGVDVFSEMIDFLRDSVKDPRFSYQPLDVHNEMYNPHGKPLVDLPGLSLPEESFDIIWLFSVFTHLAPHDYKAMLRLLRPYVSRQGRIVFSLFVNETTESGLGFIDNVNRGWSKNASVLANHKEAFAKHFVDNAPPDFVDFDTSQPLKWAVYSRKHALELVEDTGWEVESLNDPEEAIQHYMICRPVG